MNPTKVNQAISTTTQAIAEAMREHAIDFAKWINEEGYREYDEKDRWISPAQSRRVYTTEELYNLFDPEEDDFDIVEDIDEEPEEDDWKEQIIEREGMNADNNNFY